MKRTHPSADTQRWSRQSPSERTTPPIAFGKRLRMKGHQRVSSEECSRIDADLHGS